MQKLEEPLKMIKINMYLLNDNRYETVSFPKLATLAHKIKWIFVVSNFEYVELLDEIGVVNIYMLKG